jgi:malate dehydrogenase (oxaloacetate-decarboxylating)
MFLAAARALAELSPARCDPHGNLLPPLVEIRKISFQVALAVAKQAQAEGLAEKTSEDIMASAVKEKMWDPAYAIYERRFR